MVLSFEVCLQLPHHKTSPRSNWPGEAGQERAESAGTTVITGMLEGIWGKLGGGEVLKSAENDTIHLDLK